MAAFATRPTPNQNATVRTLSFERDYPVSMPETADLASTLISALMELPVAPVTERQLQDITDLNEAIRALDPEWTDNTPMPTDRRHGNNRKDSLQRRLDGLTREKNAGVDVLAVYARGARSATDSASTVDPLLDF